MKEMIFDKARKGHILIKTLGITVLALLMLVGTAGAVSYAYITNTISNTTSVIDTTDDTVIRTVDVGSHPGGVAVNPVGTRVYVANSGIYPKYEGTVSVINTTTNRVVGTVKVGNNPTGVAVSPEGKKVYVTNKMSKTISVIDTAKNEAVFALYVGDNPTGIAITSDGKKVYVAHDSRDVGISVLDVSAIDTGNYCIDKVKLKNNNSSGVAVNPAGTKAYITSYDENGRGTVFVIDTATNKVIDNVSVGTMPYGVAVNPAGTRVYVANYGIYPKYEGSVSVINTTTNKVDTVNVGNGLLGIAVTPDGKKTYVANSVYKDVAGKNISVIDTVTNSVTNVSVGSYPIAFGQFIGPSIKPPMKPPVAKFTHKALQGPNPKRTFQFIDESTSESPIISWYWDFGDHTHSDKQNPCKTFKDGTYKVRLIVKNEAGSDIATTTMSIGP